MNRGLTDIQIFARHMQVAVSDALKTSSFDCLRGLRNDPCGPLGAGDTDR